MSFLRSLHYFAATDIGLKRKRNEDTYAVYHSAVSAPDKYPQSALFAVADGMGGHSCGDLASQTACRELAGIFDCVPKSVSPEAYAKYLNQLFRSIDLKIRQCADSEPTCADMGTTLSALWIVEGFGITAHVGDSRIYRLRDAELKQLTTDHTFVQEMIEEGELSPVAAETHPFRNVLTRVVGTQEVLEKVESMPLDLKAKDRFLLCSDGLHNMVTFDGIAKILKSRGGPKQAAQRLLKAALKNGGKDNITVVVVDL